MLARYLPENNYFALFINGRTVRFRIDETKPIKKLPWDKAEVYDIAINNKCFGGCDYCYISALPTGVNYENIAEKAHHMFRELQDVYADETMVRDALIAYLGSVDAVNYATKGQDLSKVRLTTNPFQVAIGGAGEPTNHPEFVEFLYEVESNGIVPNFTTNGMKVTTDVLQACDDVVGGVSVTLHPHLERFWRTALQTYAKTSAQLHAHLVVYDESSTVLLEKYMEEFPDVTMVLLPFQYVGFGENYTDTGTYFYDTLFETIVSEGWQDRIAYGAGFHEYLSEWNLVGASLYEPHDYSYYIDLKGNGSVYTSSFEWETPLNTEILI